MIDDILEELEADTSLETGAKFAAVAARYLETTRHGDGQVSTPRSPGELARRFDEPMPRTGRTIDELIHRLEGEIIADANKYCHPMYMGHQTSAPLAAGIWIESVISALNQSLAVQEMSPTATAMEHRLMRWFAELVGYGPESGGTMTSGGTEANFTALLAARNHALPEAWEQGVGADPPFIVYGEHAHYAVTRAIGQLGLGRRRGIPVASRDFRMDVGHLVSVLDRLKSEGHRVMAVVATAGSTATGSFDDLESIADVCAEREIWLHVDGAHGASALLSARPPAALNGLRRADTIAWDPHKGMLLPLAAGALLARRERDLDGAFAQQAPYLFSDRTELGRRETAGPPRVHDQGVRSFQCSRRADVLKVWFAIQRYGTSGLGQVYDRLCATARCLYDAIGERPEFQNLHEPESNILCFRYVGAAFRKGNRTATDDARLDAINREMRSRYNRDGTGWITATVLDGRPVLRVTMMNPRTGASHVRALLDGLVAQAKKIEEGTAP